MKLIIDIPEEEYNDCKMQVELMKQEGIIIESLNTALRIFVANGKPLPKGHWLWDRGARTCSKCGQMRYIGKTTVVDNFCPNCGADMTESEVEE